MSILSQVVGQADRDYGVRTTAVSVMAGNNLGRKFGAGVYFTQSVSTALSFCPKNVSEKVVMIALVLVGQYSVGSNGLQRPPPKPGSVDLFDSCVNDMNHPTYFVIFDRNQMYPIYRVTISSK